MANVRLSWTLPVPTSRQKPLKHVLIDARTAPTLPWGAVNTVVVPTSTLLLQDIAPGLWEYRATVVDVDLVKDINPKQVSVNVGFDPPSSVTTFTGVFE